MPSSFVNANASLSTTKQTLFAASQPGLRAAVIHGLYISNTSDLTGTTVTLIFYDGTTLQEREILHATPIGPNSTLVLEKPINLKPLDELRAKTTNNYCQAFASILLLT
jgi:hypothetical protein